MIISVLFKSKKTGEYRGRQHSYLCDLPDVKPGDYVKVPAGDSESIVLVAETNVPESRIDERIMPLLKNVISIAEAPDAGPNCCCETCGEFTPIGEGDHICGADPHKMPVSDYSPTEDYLWCKGKHYTSE